MNPVQFFKLILVILLGWQSVVHADCADQAAMAGSIQEAQQICSTCGQGSMGTQCLHIDRLWCNQRADTMCSLSACQHMPACQSKPDCKKVAAGATDYWSFIRQCDSCEAQNANTVSCADGAKDWCANNCLDSMCSTMEVCGGNGLVAGQAAAREVEQCLPGQTTGKDGKPCPPSATMSLLANTKTEAQANAAASTCDSLRSRAQQACRSTGGLNNPDSTEGLNAICDALRKGNLESYQRQLQFGDQCGVAWKQCSDKCSEGAGEFSRFLQQSSRMRTSAQACQSLSAAVTQSSREGFASMSRNEVIRKCNDRTAQDRSTIDPQSGNPNPSKPSNPGTQQPSPGNSNPTASNSNPQKANSNGNGDSGGGGGGGGMPSMPTSQSSPYDSGNGYGNSAGFTNCTMDPSAPGCSTGADNGVETAAGFSVLY